MLWKTTIFEIKKLFRRGRTYIGLMAVIIILFLIEGGLISGGKSLLDSITENLNDNFYLQGNLLNGYLVTYIALNTLWLHIPVLIVIVTGDLVSGESSAGTLRLIMARPVSREVLISAKFIAAMFYIVLIVGILAVLSTSLGIYIFGKGDLIVFFKGINIIPASELPIRFAYAFLYGLLSMWMVGALSFFFSCIYENSLTPILATMALIILFTIISNFEVGILNNLKPYLFTSYMSDWRIFFNYNFRDIGIAKSITILAGHIIVLYFLSILIFNKKDITS